jgi:hypothetical protein
MDSRTKPVHPLTRRLLHDAEFCRRSGRRVEAATELVENLPRTTHDIELLLNRTEHRLSAEVQYYSVLNVLDSLPLRNADVKRLLPTVSNVLKKVNSRAASLWMKAGCLLGDGFLTAANGDTRQRILLDSASAVRTAKSCHARAGALHGIEHALNHVGLRDGKRLLRTVREVALHDRALSLRRTALALLRDGYWWGNGGLHGLHRLAKELGRRLRYP